MSHPSYNFIIICQPLTNPDTLTLALIFSILSPFLCTPSMEHYIHVRYNSPSLPLSDVIFPKAATVFLPNYGIGVSNMQTVLSEHTTHFTHSHDKLLQPYVRMAALCCTTSQQSPSHAVYTLCTMSLQLQLAPSECTTYILKAPLTSTSWQTYGPMYALICCTMSILSLKGTAVSIHVIHNFIHYKGKRKEKKKPLSCYL